MEAYMRVLILFLWFLVLKFSYSKENAGPLHLPQWSSPVTWHNMCLFLGSNQMISKVLKIIPVIGEHYCNIHEQSIHEGRGFLIQLQIASPNSAGRCRATQLKLEQAAAPREVEQFRLQGVCLLIAQDEFLSEFTDNTVELQEAFQSMAVFQSVLIIVEVEAPWAPGDLQEGNHHAFQIHKYVWWRALVQTTGLPILIKHWIRLAISGECVYWFTFLMVYTVNGNWLSAQLRNLQKLLCNWERLASCCLFIEDQSSVCIPVLVMVVWLDHEIIISQVRNHKLLWYISPKLYMVEFVDSWYALKISVPWDPGDSEFFRNHDMTAWGQAVFQEGEYVRILTSCHRLGCLMDWASEWAATLDVSWPRKPNNTRSKQYIRQRELQEKSKEDQIGN